MNRIVLRLLVGVALVALVVAGLVWRHLSPPEISTAAPPAASGPQLSGSYADDWQARCGPLVGPPQAECTRVLDAAYGRASNQPVPPAGR